MTVYERLNSLERKRVHYLYERKPIYIVEMGKACFSAEEVARLIGSDRSSVLKCCKGEKYHHTCKGYHLVFQDFGSRNSKE